MNAHEMLIAARALIEKPEKWTQGAEAKDADGYPDSALSPEAFSRCSNGALWCVTNGDDGHFETYDTAMEIIDKIAADLGWPDGAVYLNDDPSTTHADVLAMFDRAIAATAEPA